MREFKVVWNFQMGYVYPLFKSWHVASRLFEQIHTICLTLSSLMKVCGESVFSSNTNGMNIYCNPFALHLARFSSVW